MRYSPLMSVEGIAYPIVTLSLWESLFVELKSFNLALMYATLSMGRKSASKLSSLRTATLLASPVLKLLAGAGLLVGSGACAGAAGCWADCRLRAAGGWLAACTYKHKTSIRMLSLQKLYHTSNLRAYDVTIYHILVYGVWFFGSPLSLSKEYLKNHIAMECPF